MRRIVSMRRIVLYTITGILSITISLILVLPAQAQVNPNDRFFAKDFCASENTLLDDILYNDLTELSYDSSGCPVSSKVIHKWNELSVANQNLITARMNSNGYQDVTAQMIAELQALQN